MFEQLYSSVNSSEAGGRKKPSRLFHILTYWKLSERASKKSEANDHFVSSGGASRPGSRFKLRLTR